MVKGKSLLIKAVLGITAGILILCAMLASIVAYTGIKDTAERLASHRFGRPVKIGALHLTYGYPLTFELDDVHLANAAWGSDSDIFSFAHAKGSIDLHSVFFGPLRLNNFILEDASLLLERNDKGIGNWKTSKDSNVAVPHPDNPSGAARDRRSMPSVLNLILRNGHVTFRTTSGTLLRINLDKVALNAHDEHSPVNLTVEGAYNDHPVKLALAMDSFDTLHDTSKAFNADLTAKGGDGVIKLNARLMDPINFDDFYGRLDSYTKNLGSMVAVFGENFHADMPSQLAGSLERHGDEWKLIEADGRLDDNHFQGDISLNEGPRHSPDSVHVTMNFDRLNIDALRTKMDKQKSTTKGILYASANPDPLLDANFSAKILDAGILQAHDFRIHIQIAPRSRLIDNISFQGFGGNFTGMLKAEALPDGNKISALAKADNVEAQSVLALAGAPNNLTGKIEARVSLNGYGNRFDDFQRHSNGEIILFMKDGFIQTKTLHRASLDINALFDESADMTPLSCVVVAGTLKSGTILVTPIRVRAETSSLFGGGTIDLQTNNVNFDFRAEKAGALALELPIHASGNINTVHMGLGSSADVERLKTLATQNIDRLSSLFKMQVINSGCL